MRVLELFAGTQSLATAARARGHEVTTLDVCPRHGPDLCMDILAWDFRELSPDSFDYIHASCPCEVYSRARSTGGDRPLEAADILVHKTLEILNYFQGALWTIENPAGSLLWKRPVAVGLQKTRTSYCSYGFFYQKSTTFANNFGLVLRPPCDRKTCQAMVGGRHREHAQKGGGGADNIYHSTDHLHRIPPELCADILRQVEQHEGRLSQPQGA
jgi:hypothetical protein